MQPDTMITRKGKVVHGSKQNKTRVTVFVTVNADGSDKRRPMLINKSKYPIAFRKANINTENLPVTYRYNRKAWMLSGLWYEYLRNLNQSMRIQGRRIALITDNALTHPPPESPPIDYDGPPPPRLDHIKLIYLPPNTTAWLQPLDAGIIRSLKAGYTGRCRFIQHMVEYFEKHDQAAPNLDVLQVIYMVAEAWDELPGSVVFHCWQKVGLVESLDRDYHTSYKESICHIRTATQVSVLSLLDTSCNSEKVNTLADLFLDYDEEGGDVDASPEDISLTDIVAYFNTAKNHSTSDSDSGLNMLEIAVPETISIGLANTYLTEIINLLERFPVDVLQTTGQTLPIPSAVQQLRKIQKGFHHYEESKKTQGTLCNWLQTGSTKAKETEPIRVTSSSPRLEPTSPAQIPTSQTTDVSSTRTPSPPSQLLRFSPIAPDWIHNSYEALNASSTDG